MIELLEEILRTGHVSDANGELVKVHSSIGREAAVFVQQILVDIGAKATLEVGLAYGLSALCICDALRSNGGQQHVAIDPFEHSEWFGIGIENIHRAGFEDLVEFHDRPSYLVLPELVQQKRSVDFVLIDGFTTFDYKLVDAFLADKLLMVGGVMIIRTGEMIPAKKICAFVEANWPYKIFRTCLQNPGTAWAEHWIAYQKVDEDRRSWKFHVDF